MPPTWLRVAYTRASDLSPLRGMLLQELLLIDAPVSDPSPLRGMALKRLFLKGSGVTDLSPLRGMPLSTLRLTFRPEWDAEVVRALTTLPIINDKPAAEFWKEVDGKWHHGRGTFGTCPLARWRVANLPHDNGR
jgi:hypothetical protein